MKIFKDEYGDIHLFWTIVLIILGFIAFIFTIATVVRQIDYHYASTYCQDKLKEANREGKFVEYNFWEYNCLAETKNGSYIPLKNLYNNVQENDVN